MYMCVCIYIYIIYVYRERYIHTLNKGTMYTPISYIQHALVYACVYIYLRSPLSQNMMATSNDDLGDLHDSNVMVINDTNFISSRSSSSSSSSIIDITIIMCHDCLYVQWSYTNPDPHPQIFSEHNF